MTPFTEKSDTFLETTPITLDYSLYLCVFEFCFQVEKMPIHLPKLHAKQRKCFHPRRSEIPEFGCQKEQSLCTQLPKEILFGRNLCRKDALILWSFVHTKTCAKNTSCNPHERGKFRSQPNRQQIYAQREKLRTQIRVKCDSKTPGKFVQLECFSGSMHTQTGAKSRAILPRTVNVFRASMRPKTRAFCCEL